MNWKRLYLSCFIYCLAAVTWLTMSSEAQINRYGSNNYGNGGYNNYGGSRYGGGNFGGSYGGSRYGGSSYGGSSYGGSRYGGSSYGNYGGGYGSNMGSGFGSSSSRRRSGRSAGGGQSSRSSYGGGQYGGYDNYGGGYNSANSRSSRRSSRSGYGGNYGGQVPNTAASQGQAKQTTPTGMTSDRRAALSGKTSVRSALPGGSSSSSGAGGVQIQGSASTSGRPSGARGKTAPARKQSEVKTKPMATLYLDAPSKMAVINQAKVVSVVLSNNNIEYDKLSFALQYDPDDIRPVAGQDAAGNWKPAGAVSLSSSSEGAVETVSVSEEDAEGLFVAQNPGKYEITKNSIDLQNGVIEFEMNVKEGASKEGGELVNLNFLPLQETSTTISFIFKDPDDLSKDAAPLTALKLNDTDQLGSRFNENDGVINLDLQIFETLEKARAPMKVKKAGEKNFDEEEDEAFYETTLSLVARENAIDVGDMLEVDVVISNPGRDVYDAVDLLIAYNPRIFEAIDGDDFAPGVNIADQEYKDKFALDFPILNNIDTDRGIIDYRKKSMRRSVSEEGVIATIRLRAIRPTTRTTFRMFINESGEEPTTGLFYRNKDRLGDPVDSYDGVKTCTVGVRPTTAYLKQFR
ncbi:MAG: hypothetical protein JXR73_21245 [Candidatus Omnitrophica bacterium]|nr:hypothetical protein [Candidatus Omnitrophota bacterium]